MLSFCNYFPAHLHQSGYFFLRIPGHSCYCMSIKLKNYLNFEENYHTPLEKSKYTSFVLAVGYQLHPSHYVLRHMLLQHPAPHILTRIYYSDDHFLDDFHILRHSKKSINRFASSVLAAEVFPSHLPSTFPLHLDWTSMHSFAEIFLCICLVTQ